MIIVQNSESYMRFTCYEEIIDFFGKVEFESIMANTHSEYSLGYM